MAVGLPLGSPGAAVASSHDLVISQVYGGGGNSGATYTHDFVELFNRGTSSVSLDGLSIQYASATGAGNFGSTPTQLTELPNVNVGAGQYFLVQQASNAAVGDPLPTPDHIDPTPIAMAAGSGKVALVTGTTSLGCNGGSAACDAAQLARIMDLVGYGTANFSEGTAAPGLSATTAAFRAGGGCTDSDDNAADFSAAAPAPRNTASPLNGCATDVDAAPTVVTTTPADDVTGVAVDSDIEITFSEDVNVTDPWFDIDCATSGTHTAAVTGGPTSFVLNPDADFAELEECTVTILASGVTDQDTDDPPDNMAADYVFSFTIAGDVCGLPFTPIYDIQGSGNSAAITGVVTTEGVVVGDFEGGSGQQGFYLQDLIGDGDPATSDGIFVFTGGGSTDTVSEGAEVRVTGFARERFNETTINGSNSNTSPVTDIVNCGTGSVAPVDVEMPFDPADGGVPYLERFEGMLVRFPQPLVIAEYFNYDRFGEIVLALPLEGEDRHFTPTSIVEPGADANARFEEYLLRRITLDDGLGVQNPDILRHPNGEAFALDNRFRGGDTVANTVGVLGFAFSLYRIQPTAPADYTAVNLRPAEPDDVGGRLKVGALNMLNFYVTLDDGVNDICGPDQAQECRGADDEEEFDRQRVKLLEALEGMDSDVIGVNEIENTTGVEALDSIVAGLNDRFGAGSYAYIDTGTIGTDAIKVGLLYRPGTVTPMGDYAILDSSVDPRFDDEFSRPALAQTFEEVATGARFTVVVNHLKSKGSACPGDPDTGDGQGNCNITRQAAAQALVDWLATDPTDSGDPDFLITGDLNSYALEDPIDAIKAGPDDVLGTADDYTDLLRKYVGPYAYTYVFDGQNGYLDYALANASLTLQVTGATAWLINADEPDILDYDTSFKPPAQEALFEPNAFRSSDHDPVIVGLELALPGRVTGSGTFSGGSFALSAQHAPNGSLVGSTSFDVNGVGSFVSTGYDWLVVDVPAATYAGSGELDGNAGYEFLVSVHDGGNPGTRGDRIRLVIWNAAGDVVYDSQAGDPILAAPTSPLTSGNLRVSARR